MAPGRYRSILILIGLLFATLTNAQKTIWSHAVGNWRDGPVVYITPLIETSESVTTPQLLARYRSEYTELRDVKDLDALRFATPEEGNDSRTTLQAKYGIRKLEVVMLEPPTGEGKTEE